MSLFDGVKAVYKDLGYQCRLLTEIIYPRRCAVCRNEIDNGYFCEPCRKNFVLGKCKTQVENLDEVLMLYKYQQELQLAIHRVKFEGQKDLLPLLKEEAWLALAKEMENFVARFDVITCVPTSPARKAERSFDLPQEIFSFLADERWQSDLLVRVRNTIPLFDLEPALRKQEVAGCFEVERSVTGKKVLLCDDIFTTGSTMCEAALALRKAGAVGVSALAFTASKDNW